MKLLNIDNILGMYIKNFIKYIEPKNKKYKYIIYTIHFIHFILVLFLIMIFLFIPPKIHKYITILLIIIFIQWLLFRNCILTMITNYLGNTNIKYFLPINSKLQYIALIFFISLSIFIYMNPKFSPFNFLLYLNKIF